MSRPTGLAGRLAGAFVHSKLTPLVILFSLALGLLAVVALPREEEPQIIVPMIDVFVQMPGADPPRSSSASHGRSRNCSGRCRASSISTPRRAPARRW